MNVNEAKWIPIDEKTTEKPVQEFDIDAHRLKWFAQNFHEIFKTIKHHLNLMKDVRRKLRM